MALFFRPLLCLSFISDHPIKSKATGREGGGTDTKVIVESGLQIAKWHSHFQGKIKVLININQRNILNQNYQLERVTNKFT